MVIVIQTRQLTLLPACVIWDHADWQQTQECFGLTLKIGQAVPPYKKVFTLSKLKKQDLKTAPESFLR